MIQLSSISQPLPHEEPPWPRSEQHVQTLPSSAPGGKPNTSDHSMCRLAAEQMRTAARREQNLEHAERLRTLAKQLDTISPHMLRHSLAKRMLTNGAQLPEVQRVLGHTRLSTTGMYLTPSKDDVRMALGRAGI
jgi:integrase